MAQRAAQLVASLAAKRQSRYDSTDMLAAEEAITGARQRTSRLKPMLVLTSFPNIWLTVGNLLRSPFSAVSAPIFAREYSFESL